MVEPEARSVLIPGPDGVWCFANQQVATGFEDPPKLTDVGPPRPGHVLENRVRNHEVELRVAQIKPRLVRAKLQRTPVAKGLQVTIPSFHAHTIRLDADDGRRPRVEKDGGNDSYTAPEVETTARSPETGVRRQHIAKLLVAPEGDRILGEQVIGHLHAAGGLAVKHIPSFRPPHERFYRGRWTPAEP
jgi:hypothetical protein